MKLLAKITGISHIGMALIPASAVENVKLFLPETLYALEGSERSGYYDNIATVPFQKEPVFEGSNMMVMRQSNAMHPNASGYNQMGDLVFFYLKALMVWKE